MRLRVGQPAPNFDVTDISGRRIRLSDWRGQKLLISFHRAAVCPLCNVRTYHMVQRYADYRRQGLNIISFWDAPLEQAHHYLDRLQAPFPIVADRERQVYALYGLESSLLSALRARFKYGPVYREAAARQLGTRPLLSALLAGRALGRKPGDFLVGPDLRIRHAYYGRDSGDFMLFSEIDAFAANPG